jgi:hypothetical protein
MGPVDRADMAMADQLHQARGTVVGLGREQQAHAVGHQHKGLHGAARVTRVLGQAFVDWIVSPAGQAAIADYKISKISREQLLFPNATEPGA